MSTKADRAMRSKHRIMPIRVRVRQKDGSWSIERADADVRTDKRNDKRSRRRKQDHE